MAASGLIESDRNKFEYNLWAQHVEPGHKEIATRGQYRRLLKRHGLMDDIPRKEAIAMAYNRPYRQRVKREQVRELMRKMTPQMEAAWHAPRQQQVEAFRRARLAAATKARMGA